MPTKLLPTGAQHPGITPAKRPLQAHTRTKLWCYASPKQQANDSGNSPNPDITPWAPHPTYAAGSAALRHRAGRLQAVDGTYRRLNALIPAHMLHLAHLVNPCPFRWSFHSRNASTPAYNQITWITCQPSPRLRSAGVFEARGSNPAWRIPHVSSATINVTAS